MSTSALVLAAHGSRSDPECNAQVQRWAQTLEACLPFDEVHAAFHKGSPMFAEVLDHIDATNVTVIPVMTSAGYYATQVLPRELARNFTYPDKRIHITPPLGRHPAIVELIRRRVRSLANDFDFKPVRATLAIVGHGAAQPPASRLTTLNLADGLRANESTRVNKVAGQVLAALLDDEPRIAKALEAAKGDPVVVVPFFIGVGMHPSRDVPAAFGSGILQSIARTASDRKSESASNAGFLPREEIIAGRRFIFDRSVGCDEGVPEILAALARESLTKETHNQCTLSTQRPRHPQSNPSPDRKPRGSTPQPDRDTQACHGRSAQ